MDCKLVCGKDLVYLEAEVVQLSIYQYFRQEIGIPNR